MSSKARASLKVSSNLSDVNSLRTQIEKADEENKRLRNKLGELQPEKSDLDEVKGKSLFSNLIGTSILAGCHQCC